MNSTASLYEHDFYGWTQQQAQLIRAGKIAALDLDNILEEIETMGRSEKRSLKSRLAVLLLHLIKWAHEPECRGKSWMLTIKLQRKEIRELMEESPSLKPLIDSSLEKSWEKALIGAERETGIRITAFPPECPWTFAQIMNDDFWPEPAPAQQVQETH